MIESTLGACVPNEARPRFGARSSILPYFPYTDLTAPSGNAAVATSEARRDLVPARGVAFSQHSFAIVTDVRSKSLSVRFT